VYGYTITGTYLSGMMNSVYVVFLTVCDTKIWLKQNNLTIVQRIHGEIFSQIGDEKKIHEKNTKAGFFVFKN
jgi:hypothetical protein